MINGKSMVSTNSTPRSIVIINGRETEFLTWRVENTGYEQADTFEIELPFEVTSGNEDPILTSSSSVVTDLFTQKDIIVQVYRGIPRDPNNYTIDDLKMTVMGYVDTVQLLFDEKGEVIKLDGRDLSAQLIDSTLMDKYQNNTSSQIATMFANNHGLTPQVWQTSTLAGTYYNNNSSIMTNSSSEWDLLMFLAQQEGFVVRVYGTALYFGPVDKVTNASLPPINVTWGDNISNLTLERQPHGARDIEVTVLSYERKTKQRIVSTKKKTAIVVSTSITSVTGKKTAKYINSKGISNPLSRDAYKEYYRIPGLTQAQADAKAQSILDQLSQDQIVGTLQTFGEMDFTVDRQINLQGVGYLLSQIYYIQRVTETFDLASSDGFFVEIAFVNELLMPGGLNGLA